MERKKGERVFDPEKGTYRIHFKSEVKAHNGHFLIEDFRLPGEVVAGKENRVAVSGFRLNNNYTALERLEFDGKEEYLVVKRKKHHFTEVDEVAIPTRLLSIATFDIRNTY